MTDHRAARHRRRRAGAPAAPYVLAAAGYLALAVALWWGAWTTHPTSVTTCGCDDPSLFVWFLAWPAYGLAHGHNLFFSTALFHPVGINLLANTGVLTLGVPLAPVTWLFGPVATLNVASTLGPAASALALFWLLRRYVAWTPAAFVGGLVFGFGPFAVSNLAVAHLNTEILALVPLIVGCLDELFLRQRHRAVPVGVGLGLLVVAQFFLSTEILVVTALVAAVGVVVLLVAGATRPAAVGARLRHGAVGLAVAAAVAAVALAYPVWFALDGPAHLSGLVWPTLRPGTGGIVPSDIWHLRFLARGAVSLFAGYQGPALPRGEYLGVGLLAVVAAGLVLWWRDRRLWFFAFMAAVTVSLSLGIDSRYWVPWRVLAHIPLVQNVTVARVFGATTLCVAVLVGLVVDRAHTAVGAVLRRGRPTLAAVAVTVVAAGLALAVAAVAVVPLATAEAGNIPLTTQSVALPPWFATVATRLPAGQVVLTYPPPVTGGSAMTWQAVDGLRYALATGAGPESIPARAGPERAGLDVITADAEIFSTPAPDTAAHLTAVRSALTGWGVTAVVVPDPAGLVPRYDRTDATAAGLALFTLALGRAPRFVHDAWVWTGVAGLDRAALAGGSTGPGRPTLARRATSCLAAVSTPRQLMAGPRHDAVPACVLAAVAR